MRKKLRVGCYALPLLVGTCMFNYVGIGLGCVDLGVLVVAGWYARELPELWFAIAIALSGAATALMLCYTTIIQLVVFPICIWIDAKILLAIEAMRTSPESVQVISLGTIYTPAIGAVFHITAALLLFIVNLFVLMRFRDQHAKTASRTE